MSEPQHPQPHDMDTHTGRTLSAAAPAAVPIGFDSLAAVGARLAQLRESKGWSVEDVSARLKVAPGKLRRLEAGDLSQLPDTTFALGVVRSYAKMVGADPAPMTQALRREKGVPEPALTMPASAGADLPRGKVSLSLGGGGAPRGRSWIWGVALAVVVLIALAMWHTNNGESTAWLARLKGIVGAPAATENASAVAANAASAASVTAEAAASSAETDTQAIAAEGASAAPLPAPLPTAGVAPASTAASASAPGAAAPKVASAAPAVAAAASAEPASEPSAAPEGSSMVALAVKQDSWFSVRQKDGKEVFSGLVHAGETKEVSGLPPLKVTVGNKAGLDSITLDGQPVDPAKYASAKGNVARFALP